MRGVTTLSLPLRAGVGRGALGYGVRENRGVSLSGRRGVSSWHPACGTARRRGDDAAGAVRPARRQDYGMDSLEPGGLRHLGVLVAGVMTPRFPLRALGGVVLCCLASAQTSVDSRDADARLRALVARLAAGNIEIGERSEQRSLGLAAPAQAGAVGVPIEVQLRSRQDVAAVRARLTQAGATSIAAFENRIYATVTQRLRGTIAQWAEVIWTDEQERLGGAQSHAPGAKPDAAPFEGAVRTRIDPLHRRGLTGKGVRIGVLDQGFAGLARFAGERGIEAPVSRSFPASHRVENGEKHGTACVEILAAMAPGARIFAASFDGHTGSWMDAARWLLEQGVHIITYSGSSYAAPGDGTDPMARFIDETTRQSGVLWFVASGNGADRHWSGTAADADGDGYVDIGAGGNPYLAIIPMTNRLAVTVRWDDWGPDPWRPTSNQDLDAALVEIEEREARGKEIARSSRPQNGAPGRPVERITIERADLAGKPFALRIPIRGKVSPATRVHVFVETEARISPRLPAGSVLSPATAHLALAVGGVDAVTEEVAPYSAFGPTDDGRLKPEVVAPTNTRSATMAADGGRFRGTSAAAPHGAGFAAVLREAYGSATGDELRRRVLRSVRGMAVRTPHPQSGFGMLDASRGVGKGANRAFEASDEAAVVELPAAFGGPTTMADLGRRLASPPDQDRLFASVTTDREVYRIGETIDLRVRTSTDAACVILSRHGRGAYAVLGEWQVRSGQALALEPVATEPAGAEEAAAICVAAEEGIFAVAKTAFEVVE